MYMNWPINGSGTTEYLTAGIGYNVNTTQNDGFGNINDHTGSGGWFAVDGDGGTGKDYRAFDTVEWMPHLYKLPVTSTLDELGGKK